MTSHLLLPVLAQIALTLFMYIRLAGAKAGAIKRGEVDEARRALHEDAWPESVQKINNNIRNQFEVPVLFYVMALSLISLNAADMAALITCWLFVASRWAHAFVHTGSNYVPLRRNIFMFGVLLVLVLLGLCLRALLNLG